MNVSARLMRTALGLALILTSACEQAVTRLHDPTIAVPSTHDGAILAISGPGLARILNLDSVGTLELRIDEAPLSPRGESELTIGAQLRSVPISGRTTTLEQDEIAIATNFDDLNVILSLRSRTGSDLHICRYRVHATGLSFTSTFSISSTPTAGRVLTLGETVSPNLAPASEWTTPLSPCELPPEWSTTDATNEVRLFMSQIVLDSLGRAVQDQLQSPLLDLVGLSTDRVELDRRSLYEPREGTLAIQTDFATVDPVVSSDDALQVRLAVGTGARRATCVPPISAPTGGPTRPAAISGASIEDANADLGLALTIDTLAQLYGSLVLSGFSCRGLEPTDTATSAEQIPTEDLRLPDIGLNMALGPTLEVALAPATLPELRARAWSGDILLTWNDLSIDVYGEYQGDPVHVVQVDSDLTMSLKPRQGTRGFLGFEIETLSVRGVTLTSSWLGALPPNSDMERWSERLFLVYLLDQVRLPLPILNASQVQVQRAEVRESDLLLYLSYLAPASEE